jgi:hypothetical protein
VQPVIEAPLDELADTLRMETVVRDPDDPWFDVPEVELIAIDSPNPHRRSRVHVPLAWVGLIALLALAVLFWV